MPLLSSKYFLCTYIKALDHWLKDLTLSCYYIDPVSLVLQFKQSFQKFKNAAEGEEKLCYWRGMIVFRLIIYVICSCNVIRISR
jgi:hypothetical protein